jgi:ribosomal protein L37E
MPTSSNPQGGGKQVEAVLGKLHMGRSFTGHELEDSCPCPKERCGLVTQDTADPDCPQHGFAAAKTMRQFHEPRYCPAQPAIVRLAVKAEDRTRAWIARQRFKVRSGLGIGADGDGIARWDLAGTVRFWASYYLGIGHWFHDRKDSCRHCGALPSDVDFCMRRVGPFRAGCIEADMCEDAAAEWAS